MKLSDYAKKNSISYRTAHRHWKKGFISGEQLASGTIVVYEDKNIEEKMDVLKIINILEGQESRCRQIGKTTLLAKMVEDHPNMVFVTDLISSKDVLLKYKSNLPKEKVFSLSELDKLKGTDKYPVLDNNAIYTLIRMVRKEIEFLRTDNKKKENAVNLLKSVLKEKCDLKITEDDLIIFNSEVRLYKTAHELLKNIKDSKGPGLFIVKKQYSTPLNTFLYRIQQLYVGGGDCPDKVINDWVILEKDWKETCEFDWFQNEELTAAFCNLLSESNE